MTHLMGSRPLTRRHTRPLSDEESAALAQCSCRLVACRPHNAAECAPVRVLAGASTSGGAAS